MAAARQAVAIKAICTVVVHIIHHVDAQLMRYQGGWYATAASDGSNAGKSLVLQCNGQGIHGILYFFPRIAILHVDLCGGCTALAALQLLNNYSSHVKTSI